MFKNVLITGGAGFIGSNLALKLVSKGYNVTVLDNLSPQIHGDNPQESSPLFLSIKDKVNFILGTVTSKSDWELALKDQDAIIHLAAETGTGQSMYEVQKYVDVNINGTALMLDLLVNNSYPVKKVIVASSRSIYGEGKYISKELGVVYPTQRTADYMDQKDFEVKYHGSSELELVATDEESKIHPSSVYGITKQNQEQMVLTVCSSMGIAGVAFRYQNVYGPGQSLKNPYTGILSIFSTQIKNGNKINIFEDGKESRDFVYIDDVVEATILGLEKEEANNQVFNVGTGIATSVLTVADQLVKNYNIDVPITISGNYRLGDIRHNYADLTKIKKYLGFEPKVSFEEGIKEFTQWVNTQEIQEDRYQQSINEMKEKGLYK
ncbi:NAD-dependent epimerase/dehydratase family protein [Acinetobacter pittii]|nr:NAD-dependent epimerase/dehydratase family protein [Acinetobacter seifertii]MCH2003482.1 NAD-dependent epimerase/dehydratase family protein [Acinetobacter seifertii]